MSEYSTYVGMVLRFGRRGGGGGCIVYSIYNLLIMGHSIGRWGCLT